MCLIVFSREQHPDYRLVLAANRDEFYERPTAPAAFWDDAPEVLAGRDLKAGGTWMGVTRAGRWAAITNYRDPSAHDPDAPSRGHLVADYLRTAAEPETYLSNLAPEADRYNGFNLLVGTVETAYYFSNREGTVREIGPGLYGLSNHLLDSAWPKVERGKRKLAGALERDEIRPEPLLDLLHDTARPVDERLPDTGIGLAGERVLSPLFIQSDNYGTRSSTVLLIAWDAQVTFVERTYDNGEPAGTRRFSFEATSAAGVRKES